MMRLIQLSLLIGSYLLLFPFIFCIISTFWLTKKITLDNFLGKLGWNNYHPKVQTPHIWIHVSSLGEWNTLKVLVGELEKILKDQWKDQLKDRQMNLVVSYFNQDIKNIIENHPQFQFIFLPVENPLAYFHIIRKFKIKAVVIGETEIWPFFIWSLKLKNIPTYIVNATLFDQERKGYQKFGWLFRPLLLSLKKIFPSSTQSKNNFVKLGVKGEQIGQVGNLKLDNPTNSSKTEKNLPPTLKKLLQKSKVKQTKPTHILVFASFHLSEVVELEEFFLSMIKHPDYRIIIVPRDTFESDAIINTLTDIDPVSEIISRSKSDTPKNLVWDRYGEMGAVLKTADLVIMGGTFTPIGGHNIVEPIALNKPVMLGPHYFHFKDLVEIFKDSLYFANSKNLNQEITKWFKDEHPPGKDYGQKQLEPFQGLSKKIAQDILSDLYPSPQ